MKQGKRIKPKFPIEYRLLIVPRYNDREKKDVTFVGLQTVNEFTNFLYEIIVEDSVAEHDIHLRIQGLRAPRMSFPGVGPATFKREYPDLEGTYNIIVTKLEREENTFVVDISKTQVLLQKSPAKKFVELVTKVEEWQGTDWKR